MNKFLFGLLMMTSLIAVSATPKQFNLKMDLSIDGKHASSPQLIVKEGQKALIQQGDKNQTTFIEVVAIEEKSVEDKSILMKFVIGTIEKDGSRKVISTPQIRTLPSEKAEVRVGDQERPEAISFSVIPTPVTL